MKFLKEDEEPVIKTAVTYMVIGTISDDEFAKIKSYCINPVDSSENKRRAFGRSRERRGGCRRQTDAQKSLINTNFRFFSQIEILKKKI